MLAMKRWRVDVFLGEQDGRTHAEARLHTELGDHLLGVGRARLNPNDSDVPEIGDEIAVARALADLGHRLRRYIVDEATRRPVASGPGRH
jgi:hypothetical protein